MSRVSRESYDLWVKEEVTPNVLSEEQVTGLLQFIEGKISLGSSDCDIGADKTAWDDDGVVERLWQILDASVREKFAIKRDLKISKVLALKTEKRGYYYERYWEIEEDSQIKYSGVVTLSEGYGDGESVYFRARKSVPVVGDMMIHRHEKLNSWAINTVTSGVRLDIVLTLEELKKD